MKFLSFIPFVLCNLMAADDGSGGGGDPTPTPAPEPAPVPEPEPVPTGNTLEEKQTSALGIITNLWQRIGQTASQLATANGQRDKLQGQFNDATTGWNKEKEAHTKTTGQLATANTTIAGLTSERDNANSNVTRLEKLCGLHGVPIAEAAPVPANNLLPDDKSPAGKWAKYQGLKKQENEGTVPSGTAMTYWRENQVDLDKYAASKR
jgi:hypothetical protein